MPNPFHYANTLYRLARLSDPDHPGHVRVRAAITLAIELSPANPRRALVQRLLQEANPFALAQHKLRDLYDRPEPLTPEPTPAHSQPEEEPPPEDDEPP